MKKWRERRGGPANNSVDLGHMNASTFDGSQEKFLGFQFIDGPRVRLAFFRGSGSARYSALASWDASKVTRFAYDYDPNAAGGLGQVVGYLYTNNVSSPAYLTLTLTLAAGDNATAVFDAWGIATVVVGKNAVAVRAGEAS